jgi:tRNA G18 (ribose-2'-O)-methylase SpoU
MPFSHQRHKRPIELVRPRGVVVVVPPVQSNVNLSRIVRAAGCLGIRKLISIGTAKLDRKIARDAADYVEVQVHRSVAPVIAKHRAAEFRIVALEQATDSTRLFDYGFMQKTLLLLGHERHGIDDETLALVDDVVEIPVYGLPHSFNLATSAVMAMYEYCRQFPDG